MKKLITLVVCVSLLFSHPAQANFFTDLFGGLFTIVSYPIQLILGSTKAPFFVAQNPFVEKEWHKEERVAVGRKAADNAQQEGQNTPTLEAASPTPIPKTASPTPFPTTSIPAKKSVAPSASPTPAPSTPTESTQTSGEVRDKDKGASWWKRTLGVFACNAVKLLKKAKEGVKYCFETEEKEKEVNMGGLLGKKKAVVKDYKHPLACTALWWSFGMVVLCAGAAVLHLR
jgi:hypothetical protein